jgi:hypothetical protein
MNVFIHHMAFFVTGKHVTRLVMKKRKEKKHRINQPFNKKTF